MIVDYIWVLIALAVLCLGAAYVIWYAWNAHLAYRGERQRREAYRGERQRREAARGERQRREAARAAADLAVVDVRTAYAMLDRKPGVRRGR